MAARKSPSGTRDLSSKTGTESSVTGDETRREKTSGSQKAQGTQNSELEKVFARQDKGFKDAFKLF
jgi:hypothetical protein